MRHRPRRSTVIVFCFLGCLPSLAHSQDLLRQATKPDPQPPKQETDDRPEGWHFRWAEHPSLRFGDVLRLDFRGRFSGELTSSEARVEDIDATAFDVARRRVGIEGRITDAVEFQVEGELNDDEPWRDVYANYRQFDVVQVQAGKFKLPFSLDENTSSTNLDFAFRSRAATQLSPGRDIGVMVHGRVVDRIVRYELGIFEHDGRNARTRNPERVYGGQTLAGRVAVEPFRNTDSGLRDLRVGLAFTGSDLEEGFSGIRGRTALDQSFFPSDYWVEGRRRRLGFEVQWRPGPFSVKSEYIRLTDERRGQGVVDDEDLSPLLAEGWYLSGTWAVTGEDKADGLDNPRRPIFRGGIGAVEVAARVEELSFGSEASGEPPSASPRADVVLGNSDRAITLGANWYLNRWIKVQFNLFRETIDLPGLGPLPSKPSFWSRVFRFQLTI
jgi:phosphate-selective porin OprO and OprP